MTHPYGQNIRTPDGKWPPNAQTCSADDDSKRAAQRRLDAAQREEFKRPPVWRDEMEAELAEKAEVGRLWSSVSLTPNGSSGDPELEAAVAEKMLVLFRLFKDRQRKYGPGNIAAFGDLGVCVRAQDKLARLRHHYFGGGAGDMPDESVDDAWRDLAVYAVIALVCREGGWPGYAAKGGAK